MRKLSDRDRGCLESLAGLAGIVVVFGLAAWLFPLYGPTPTRSIIAQWVIIGALVLGAVAGEGKKRVIRRREASLLALIAALSELRSARTSVPPDDAASQRYRMAVSRAIDKAGVWGVELSQLPDDALETIERYMANVDVLAQVAAARGKRINGVLGVIGVVGVLLTIYTLVPK